MVDETRNAMNNSILGLIGWGFGGFRVRDEDRKVLTLHGRAKLRLLVALARAFINLIQCRGKWSCSESLRGKSTGLHAWLELSRWWVGFAGKGGGM